ncbi:hypothetical protein SIN09_00945 [Streptomyces sp. F8]|uniref:hypothetical protein n=1 Tax=Streptomyces sp. F8 TaxID=1436085 RepID=UPI0029D10BBB|nr:hypothetical protein [Streptomyces sp. F8]MDX6758047.1 hypothetical protein [Streptomyces sp. F8]
MSDSMSAPNAASTSGGNFKLDCGKVHLKAQNVSERVQLMVVSTVSVALLGALSLGAWVLVQDSCRDREEDE